MLCNVCTLEVEREGHDVEGLVVMNSDCRDYFHVLDSIGRIFATWSRTHVNTFWYRACGFVAVAPLGYGSAHNVPWGILWALHFPV